MISPCGKFRFLLTSLISLSSIPFRGYKFLSPTIFASVARKIKVRTKNLRIFCSCDSCYAKLKLKKLPTILNIQINFYLVPVFEEEYKVILNLSSVVFGNEKM